jgi:hypothetical protein
MAEIAKNTDLTKLEGNPSADVDADHLPIETLQVRAWLGRGGDGLFELATRTDPRSALGTALAVLPPAIAGCLLAAPLVVLGAPVWVVCCVLLVPSALWELRRRTGMLRRQPRR